MLGVRMKTKKQNNHSKTRYVKYSEKEINRLRRTEAYCTGQNQVLELLARDASLESVLTHLVHHIEDQISEMICSILIFDPVTKCLCHGAAPNLPGEYIKSIDGVIIGEGVGSCGTSAHRGELVIVEDIKTDPLWTEYRDLALKHNLHACWSQPVFSSNRSTLRYVCHVL